jgi:hypothetical protein
VNIRVGGMDVAIADSCGGDDDEIKCIKVSDSNAANQARLMAVITRLVPSGAIVVTAITCVVCGSMRRTGGLPSCLCIDILAIVIILREITLDQLDQPYKVKSVTERQRERETERGQERQRDRERERQREVKRDRERETERERQRERDRERDSDREVTCGKEAHAKKCQRQCQNLFLDSADLLDRFKGSKDSTQSQNSRKPKEA